MKTPTIAAFAVSALGLVHQATFADQQDDAPLLKVATPYFFKSCVSAG